MISIPAEIKNVRRLLEIAYLYAWGQDGTPELRYEWMELNKILNVGIMVYHANGQFTWN